MKIITTSYIDGRKSTTVVEKEAVEEVKAVENNVINLYPELTYQTFLGFGGAITEAAGYAFSKLNKENQEKVLDLYFSPEGNNYHMVRSHMDSCDFSLGVYSAMTDPKDEEMKSFSLERDEQYILPFLQAAQQKRGEPLDIMLSPWSPPAFMKTNEEKCHGGKLKAEYHKFWSEYICRYIKEYKKRGFVVNRITIQNEPDAIQTWDSCTYNPREEKEFLRDYLYPALMKNDLSEVKINIWDHNKERLYERARAIIDSETDKMIDGVAFHWYSGDHFEAIQITHEVFPDKELIFTEGCVEYSRFSADQLYNAQMYAHDILGNLNAGMTGFMDWNILLDEKGGPNHVGNYCDAPIMVNTMDGTFDVKLSFDYIGHFSKYIKHGARRIACTKYCQDLEVTAFRNMDESIVMVVLNRTEKELPINLRHKGELLQFDVLKQSIVTVLLS